VRDSCSDRKDEINRHRRQQDDGFEALPQRRSFNRFKKLRLTLRWRDRFFSVSECDGFQGVQWSLQRLHFFHRTTITLQYSDAGRSGVQLNTLAPPKGPSSTGKVHVSPARTRVPVGNTEISAETDALFALCTKQTSDPVLFQFGMICVRTFDNVLVFLTAASAEPPRATVAANTNAKIQTLNFPNISFPSKLGPPTLTLQ